MRWAGPWDRQGAALVDCQRRGLYQQQQSQRQASAFRHPLGRNLLGLSYPLASLGGVRAPSVRPCSAVAQVEAGDYSSDLTAGVARSGQVRWVLGGQLRHLLEAGGEIECLRV